MMTRRVTSCRMLLLWQRTTCWSCATFQWSTHGRRAIELVCVGDNVVTLNLLPARRALDAIDTLIGLGSSLKRTVAWRLLSPSIHGAADRVVHIDILRRPYAPYDVVYWCFSLSGYLFTADIMKYFYSVFDRKPHSFSAPIQC